MKNVLLIFAIIATSFSVVAQNNTVDEKLLAKYSVDELNNMKTNSPDEYKLISYCVDHAWYLQALPKEKVKSNPGRVGSIQIKDLKNINFYALGIDIIKDDYQFFAIEGTDQMLVIKSMNHIRKELNK